MLLALIALAIVIILILVALLIGVKKETQTDEESLLSPVIHQSGIYSIVRQSPREAICQHKPSTEELQKYLTQQNVDMNGTPVAEEHKKALLKKWEEHLEKSIITIEQGDRQGTQFYFYKTGDHDTLCKQFIREGTFVTREQIFHYPSMLPPFHLGCNCELESYSGDEDLRSTVSGDTSALFGGNQIPRLPDWKNIL